MSTLDGLSLAQNGENAVYKRRSEDNMLQTLNTLHITRRVYSTSLSDRGIQTLQTPNMAAPAEMTAANISGKFVLVSRPGNPARTRALESVGD